MGFGKAFGLALIIYIALNFVFGMLSALLGAGIDIYFNSLTSDPMYFIFTLFAPILVIPSSYWVGIYTGVFDSGLIGLIGDLMNNGGNMLTILMALLGGIIPPLLAAIIAGRTGESKGAAFGGWLLTAIISAVIALVFVGFLATGSTTLQLLRTGYGFIYGSDMMIYIALILLGLVNGIFYGAFAAVSASEGF